MVQPLSPAAAEGLGAVVGVQLVFVGVQVKSEWVEDVEVGTSDFFPRHVQGVGRR